MTDPVPLEPSTAWLRTALGEALDAALGELDGLAERPVRGDGDVPRLLAEVGSLPVGPEAARTAREVVDLLVRAARAGYAPNSPGLLAYIPIGGLPTAALADVVVSLLTPYAAVRRAGPVMAAIEDAATRWMADLVGYGSAGGGIHTSGGSLANLSAVVTARSEVAGGDPTRTVLYTSDQAHHSVHRAARLAGIRAVRAVATDDRQRMRPDHLAAAVAADRAAGWRPIGVVSSAGTTNTGAVDPLAGIGDLASGEGLWHHVDAAYGGFFLLTERGRGRLAGIERSDSVTLDPHKGLFLPAGSGALVVRDRDALARAHAGDAAYLADLAVEEPGGAELSPELTRSARGARVWAVLQLHGTAAFAAALDEKLDLARAAHARLSAHPRLLTAGEPDLSVVAFRHHDGDRATAQLLDAVAASGRALLSSTELAGTLFARLAVLNQRTHPDRVDEALDLIEAAS